MPDCPVVILLIIILFALFSQHTAQFEGNYDGVIVIVEETESRSVGGDPCALDSGEPGTCTDLEQCPYAMLLLKANKRPTSCGFRRFTPIVCCPSKNEPDESTVPPGNITKEACNNYYPKPLYRTLVFGGKKSLAKEFPHMAILGYGDEKDVQWLCGGSLISEQFVLTAAHCQFSQQFGKVQRVRLGDLDIRNTTDDAQPQDFNVLQVFAHPDYLPPAHYNDIALIKLDREATFNLYVKPACLETEHDIKDGAGLIATGWGKTDFAGESSTHLMKVGLKYIDNIECSQHYQTVSTRKLQRGIEDASQMCAGDPEGKDTCPGDSGGPLQFSDYSTNVVTWKVVGVTSFGKACGITNSSGVYTRVSHYVSWIEKIVWPNFVKKTPISLTPVKGIKIGK